MKKLLLIILLLLVTFFFLGAQEDIARFEDEIKTMLAKVSPSLVKVVTENGKRYIATGIALLNDEVITSSLVTRQPFKKIYVETGRGERFQVTVVGEDRPTSITLLKLGKKALTPIRLAGKAEMGDWVALVGAFYNQFPAIFQGLVSSIGPDELILNAPVVPGASGGAVINRNAELIGVIRGSFGVAFNPDYTFRDHSAEIIVHGSKADPRDLCYAVPVKKVLHISELLKKYGRIRRGWLGVNLAEESNRVTSVIEASPAQRAGLAAGDELLEIDGKKVPNAAEIIAVVQASQPGQKVQLKIRRKDQTRQIYVQIGEWRDAKEDFPEEIDITIPELPHVEDIPELKTSLPQIRNFVLEYIGSPQLGVDVLELTPELAEKFKIKEGYGIMVSKTNPDSAARQAGLQAGDIIAKANSRAIRSVADLRRALSALQEKEPLLIELYRDGQAKKISVQPKRQDSFSWKMDKMNQRLKKWQEAEKVYLEKRLYESEQEAQEVEKLKEEKFRKELEKQMAAEKLQLQQEVKKLILEKEKQATELKKKFEEEIRKLKEDAARKEKQEKESGQTL